MTKYWRTPRIKMIVEKEPIHFNKVKSETHKILELTSHVHLKMLMLSQYLVMLPPLSLDYCHSVLPFLVPKAHTI